MSDRRNRDVGRKRQHQQDRGGCDCWLCTDGKTKLREKKRSILRRQLSDLASGRAEA